MSWKVTFDPDFEAWFVGLEDDISTDIAAAMLLLAERGPQLGRPYADTLEDSDFPNMKELRIQHAGKPWRVLFAFDPERSAILLVGGCKGGDKRWYKRNIPIADARFRRHWRVEGTRGTWPRRLTNTWPASRKPRQRRSGSVRPS
jgi:hypothetical protein